VDVLSTGQAPTYEEPKQKRNCPWGFTVVDDVAPAYKIENYLTTQPLLKLLCAEATSSTIVAHASKLCSKKDYHIA